MACSSKYKSDDKEHIVNTAVILCDISSHHVVKSLMFYHGLDCAEKGCRVVYISTKPLMTLPLPMHGSEAPDVEVLKRIWCLYLNDKKELLTYLYNLHLKTLLPHVIIIENLASYYEEDTFEQAMVNASLLESINYCSEHHKAPVYLSVCISTSKVEVTPVLETFFYNIWQCNNEGTMLTKHCNLIGGQRYQFEFAKIGDNGSLKLERVTQIYQP